MKNIILKLAATLFLLVVLPLGTEAQPKWHWEKGTIVVDTPEQEAAVDSLSAEYIRTLKTKGPKAAEKLLKKHNTLSCQTLNVKSDI